jgi:tRNA(adenine34) deaminase
MSVLNPLMLAAFKQAEKALQAGEVPVGAVVVYNQKIISSAHNLVCQSHDPTAHAEILVLREASQILKTPYLNECELYVTLEPCAMCAAAISWARIKHLCFGAYDPKGGGVEHNARVFDHSFHKPEVIGGICEKECAELMVKFFQSKR